LSFPAFGPVPFKGAEKGLLGLFFCPIIASLLVLDEKYLDFESWL